MRYMFRLDCGSAQFHLPLYVLADVSVFFKVNTMAKLGRQTLFSSNHVFAVSLFQVIPQPTESPYFVIFLFVLEYQASP